MKRAALLLALSASLFACSKPADAPSVTRTEAGVVNAPAEDCTSRAYPNIGGPIALIDETGRAVTEADFKGSPSLVFFGFTLCPDVCPSTLVRLKRAMDQLPEGMTPPRVILITVDPARDTSEKLALYIETKAFPENLTALTGSDAAIKAAADKFYASYSRIEQPESSAGYTMDHTSLIYLMDENWTLKTFFMADDTPDTIASCLTKVMQPEK